MCYGQIRELISNYIDKEETMILVVVPTNVDIHTTELLNISKQVGPEGERTIGFLSKCILIEH